MKSCTQCNRTYQDEAIRFCLDDGTPLLDAAQAVTAMQYGATMPPVAIADRSTQQAEAAAVGGGGPATYEEGATHPQAPWMAGAELQPGSPVGEYVVERKIGEGGMGMIFAASHPIIGKRVAIKVLNPAMAANPEVVQRFIQEAKSVNQIRNRNIVDIFSFGTLPDGRSYFAMEFLEGESLAQRLARAPMPWHEAVGIWLQVASAVEAAHRQGIVHRDLKPDNIFLVPQPEGAFVKVLDFGIAKLMGDGPMGMTKTATGMPIGTPTYMSPEQAGGAAVDHRTDLYAFGVILFEAIAGRPPFQSPTLVQLLSAHMNDPPPKIDTLVNGVDPKLIELVDKLLAKEPSSRPPNMGEVRTAITTLRDNAIAENKPLYGDAMPPSARRTGKSKVPLVAAGLAVAVLATGGILFVGSRKQPTPQPVTPVVVAPVTPTAPTGPKPGRVTVSTNAQATRVYLDKSATEKSPTPTAAGGSNLRINVPPNVDWILRVEADGFKTQTMPLRIGDGEETALPVVLSPDAPAPVPVVATKHGSSKKPDKPTEKPAAPKKTEDGKFLNPFDN
jgi:serine/threonine-protein kinase